MLNNIVPAALLLSLAAPAFAQATGGQEKFKFSLDGLLRQEWTNDIPDNLAAANPDSHWRIQARPRIDVGLGSVAFGVGAEFNYSEDENVEPKPALLRDNYDSKDARVDLAYLALKPSDWLVLEGGRIEMPAGLTEMIWDKDLRPQGGALTLQKIDSAGTRRFGLTGLWSKGSHVFDDEDVTMWLASLEVGLSQSLSLTGSYLQWDDPATLEPMLRRQNRRVGAVFQSEYKVFDVVGRLFRDGEVPLQLVADYCWNTEADDLNKGLWLSAVLGSTRTARGRLEYTYAKVDRDATLGAYAADDFFWTTGWEGHRLDLGIAVGKNAAVHGTAQRQRFKDSPVVEEQDDWITRYRVDLRVFY
jgi:hypothetical protein